MSGCCILNVLRTCHSASLASTASGRVCTGRGGGVGVAACSISPAMAAARNGWTSQGQAQQRRRQKETTITILSRAKTTVIATNKQTTTPTLTDTVQQGGHTKASDRVPRLHLPAIDDRGQGRQSAQLLTHLLQQDGDHNICTRNTTATTSATFPTESTRRTQSPYGDGKT